MNDVGDANPPVPALDGCRVVITREQRGELGAMLADRGADVIHVPLIEVIDAEAADVARLRDAVALGPDWIVVTSAAGAERVAGLLDGRCGIRVAVVGTATARRLTELCGCDADLVPSRQLGAVLAEEFNALNSCSNRVVVAQADAAGNDLVDGLRSGGHEVTVITAYRTVLRQPSDAEISEVEGADAVLFASGSAAKSWSASLGLRATHLLPPITVAIGPTTAAAAEESGLKISAVSTDHSLAGLLDTLTTLWQRAARTG